MSRKGGLVYVKFIHFIRWPTSVKAKLFSSRQNFLSQGKTFFPKAKLGFPLVFHSCGRSTTAGAASDDIHMGIQQSKQTSKKSNKISNFDEIIKLSTHPKTHSKFFVALKWTTGYLKISQCFLPCCQLCAIPGPGLFPGQETESSNHAKQYSVYNDPKEVVLHVNNMFRKGPLAIAT